MSLEYKTYECEDCGEQMEYICEIFECDSCGSSNIELIKED